MYARGSESNAGGRPTLHDLILGWKFLPFYQNLEPNKCEGWSWKGWSEIKACQSGPKETEELFLPIANLIKENPDLDLAMGLRR
jgi:hypothetical protein